MSIEKVKRYVVDTYSGCLVEDVKGKVHNKGYRYIKVDDVAGLVEALKALTRGYVNTLEAGRDRVVSLGGRCDALGDMETYDVHLQKARNELARWQS